jgi:hypothetical protein
MNRQLKFRIWDKQNKNWLKNSNSLHCYSNWTICPFTGNLVDYVGTFDGDHEESFTASPAADYYLEGIKFVKEPRYVIQQYTGLKDSKGVEIYEGDIVKWHVGENNLSEVIFQNGSFMVRGINWGAFWYLSDYCDFYKIIGSIMQNPELIKNSE